MSDVSETPSPTVRRAPPGWHWGTREHLLARIEQKREVVLSWLGTEIFSTARVLGQVLGLKKTGTYQTLAAMKRDGLIDFQVIEWHAASLQIVVLSPHGAAMAGKGGEGYQQGKVAASSIGHQLDVQQARFHLERAGGWTEWVAERALKEQQMADANDEAVPPLERRWPKLPDGVGRSKTGRQVAIEMERSIKTSKNYQSIAGQYLHMQDELRLIDRVLYVTTSDRVRDALQSKFSALATVVFPADVSPNGSIAYERRAFEDGQKRRFFFASMDDLKTNTSPRHAAETAEEYLERIEKQKQQQQAGEK